DFTFKFPNIVATAPVSLKVLAGAAAFNQTSFAIKANGQQVGTILIPPLADGTEMRANSLPANTTIPAAENITITVDYQNNGVPGSRSYLDYIILQASRNLKGYGKQFRFRYNSAATTSGLGEFSISTASGITQVWDISDI